MADDYANVSNAVDAVRLDMEAALGHSVPSLSLFLQTPSNSFFVSSAATPGQTPATNTTFRFASNTKNFTATAVLLLQQMGLLNITNRIVDMIPGTDQPFVPAGTNWAIPNKNIITIEQLLRHSAGIYDVDNDEVPGCGGTSYTGYMTSLDPAHQFTVEEMVAQAALHQLVYFAPDQGYHYSNTGYAMLAEIVGRVYSHYMGEAKTLSDFLYDMNVVGPDIRFPNQAGDTALPEPFSSGTERQPSNITIIVSNCNMSAQVGEGNGYGNRPALNRFIRANMKGEGVLSNESIRLMKTDTSPHNANYGFGCTWTADLGFGHNGCRVGNLSLMAYNPDTDVSLAVYLPLVDYGDSMNSFMICFQGIYNAAYRALEALGYLRTPVLTEGATTNLNVLAHQTNLFFFTTTKDVYYGVAISNANSGIRLQLAPAVNPEARQSFTNCLGWICPSPGTYRLEITSEANTPASVRLYTLTNTIRATSALITNLMHVHGIPALSIALVDGNNIVWAQGFGMADREAGVLASADTIYRIASCSKTFAAASVMRLQDDGLLSIQDDVTNAVPAFSMLPRYPDQSCTIRDLLAHQAQLPGCYFRHADSTIPFDGYYDMTLALLAEDYLVEPPGFLQKYKNNGFTLVEGVVAGANTNGLDYAAFASANLFQPLGMTNTTFRLSENQTSLLARVYRNGIRSPDEYVNTPGSGGAYSTASDLARYARFLLGYGTFNGVSILSSNAVAALWSDQSDQVALVNKEGYAKSGLGWDQVADESFAYAGKMAWKDGDSLNYSAIICVMPEHGLAAVALNSIPGADTAAAPATKMALKMALLERFGLPLPSTNPPAFPVSPVTTLTEQELAGIVGRYSAEGGYDLVTGTVSAITWISGANGASPIRHEGLVPHEDGWFCVTNDPAFRLTFTNIGGRVIMRNHVRYEEYLRIIVQAERFTPAPLSAAWSNRVGKTWITADLEPESYLWLLGMYPTLQLDIADGVLSVYSSPCQTLQPQNDDLAFPFSMNASQPSALQVKHTNGHEVIRYSGYDFHSLDDLPVLQLAQSATGTLAAGGTTLYRFSIADPVWHNLQVLPTNLVIRHDAPGSMNTPGTYSLILQNPATSAVPYSLRLYNLTNTIAAVSATITNLMEQNNVSGLSIALVDGQHLAWSQGFGMAVVESNIAAAAQTVYRIGSVSKIFTTLSALKLWEDGLIDLEAPITNYVPDFSILPRFAGDRTPTVRECLNHQSGLPGDLFRNGFATAPWDGYNDWLLNSLATDYPNYPTAFRSVYCNTGFQLIEELIKHISGSSLYDYAESNFFGPMGMASSSYLKNKSDIADHLAHAYAGETPCPEEFVNIRATGGMYSSVENMAALIRLILAEGRFGATNLLASDTIAAMMTDQTVGLPMDVTSDFRPGLGWDTLSDSRLNYAGRLCQKDGQTFTYYCSLIILRDRQLGVVVMNNTPDSLPADIAHEALVQALLERDGLAQPTNFTPVATAPTNWPPETVAAVTGLYVTDEGMSSGYDFLDTAPDGTFSWTVKAHEGTDRVFTGLVPHVDGWLYAADESYPRLLPTNILGHAVLVYGNAEPYGATTQYRGERYTPPPIHAAWSNRLDNPCLPVDMPPSDLYWFYSLLETDLRLSLTQRDGLVWLTCPSGQFVIAPSNDSLAFAAGSAVRRGASLVATGTNDHEILRFSSYTYRRADSMPALPPAGSPTNVNLDAGEIQWFSFNAASGVTYFVSTSNNICDVKMNVVNTNGGAYDWMANHLAWNCPVSGTYWLGLAATSSTPCSLDSLAYRFPAPADFSALDWTNAFLAAHEKLSREYAFTQWKSIDWTALRSQFLPRIAQAQAMTNEMAYYQALHEYVASIPDGHVSLSATNPAVPAALGHELAGGGFGLALAELDDGRVIAGAIVTNGPADLAGILPGAEILAWDGVSATTAVAQVNVGAYPLRALASRLAIMPQATREHYRLEQLRLLPRAPVGTPVEIAFQNPGAESPETTTLTAVADTNQTFALLDFARRAEFTDEVEYRILPEGYGYILLRMEQDIASPGAYPIRIFEQFQAAMTLFATSGVPGLILDIRGNFGGSDHLAADLCGFFYSAPTFYEAQEYYNDLTGGFSRFTLPERGDQPFLDFLPITPQTPRYAGPVVALVNPGTISSGEGPAMGISRLPNGRVIGFHGTDGSFGMVGGRVTLPGGYSIGYPFGRSLDQSGTIQLDSKDGIGGIPPDLRIPKTFDNVLAYAAGTDVELQYAIAWLQGSSLAPGSATNLSLAAGETAWLTMTAKAGIPLTLDLVSTNRVAACVTDLGGAAIGRLLDAYGLTFTPTNDATYNVAVSAIGSNPATCRLAVYTNALPFRRPARAEEIPDFMTNRWYHGATFSYVHVPASRVTNDLHSYRLPVVQLAAGPDATNGPMIFLTGGPGSSAIHALVLYAPFSNTCPVIAVNQRGTYLSQPDLFPHPADESATQLQARLGGPGGMDFNTINTRENAADIHDVMTALGYSSFNIWGTSYGTMLGQQVIRHAPDRIRSAVLDGVVTMDLPQWTLMAQSFFDAVVALTNDVANDPYANHLYPDFATQFFNFAATLYPDSYNDFFDNVFHTMNLSRWGYAEFIPSIVWRAARGETAALDDLHAIRIPVPDMPPPGPVSPNMYCAILRHDMLPFESMTNAAALTNSIPYPLNMHGYAYSQEQYDLSEDWAFLTPADASFRMPVTNDVPVLIMNGAYDTQTSLSNARHVATNLPHAYYVEFPTIGHTILFGGDLPARIARDFLVNPDVCPDTNGIAELALDFAPPWPTNAPPLPFGATLTNSFLQPHSGAWYSLTATNRQRITLEWNANLPMDAFHILDTNAAILATATNGTLSWHPATTDAYYLWILSSSTNTLTFNTRARPFGLPAFWPILLDRP